MLISIYLYRCQWKIVVDYLAYKYDRTCIFQFQRQPLAPKGGPILRDDEFAITGKKVVARLT